MTVVALTFDVEHPDGPRCPPGVAERIVSLLRDNDIRASFFLQGRWARAYPDLARQLAADGHVVGNHSHTHANLSHFSAAGLVAELQTAEDAIAESAGVDPRPWFRCPYGTHSHGPHLEAALTERGYHDVHGNVTTEDWARDVTAASIAAQAIRGITAHDDGAVVLLHSWPAVVPDALARIIDHVGERAGRFVTVAQVPPDPSWLCSAFE